MPVTYCEPHMTSCNLLPDMSQHTTALHIFLIFIRTVHSCSNLLTRGYAPSPDLELEQALHTATKQQTQMWRSRSVWKQERDNSAHCMSVASYTHGWKPMPSTGPGEGET